MKASEFASKNKFSRTDTAIVDKLFGKEEKEEKEWFSELKSQVTFDHSPYNKPEPKTPISNTKAKKEVEKVVEKEIEPKK